MPSYKTTLLLWQKLSVWVKLLNPNLKKQDKVQDHILSILRLVEIKQGKDIEVKESEEELYYESEKSV